jgi:hypothetical protein
MEVAQTPKEIRQFPEFAIDVYLFQVRLVETRWIFFVVCSRTLKYFRSLPLHLLPLNDRALPIVLTKAQFVFPFRRYCVGTDRNFYYNVWIPPRRKASKL